jgi:fructuronate reductase
MQRLCAATLRGLPADVARPAYDRAAIKTGIVHLGLGAFHRGHEAIYTEAALAAGDPRWGILGASLRSPHARDVLSPQDFLYTVASRDAEHETLETIGALRGVLVASENPEALIDAMTDPGVAVVSLTVTEKGYCLDPSTGALDEDHADVRHDLGSPQRPCSAPGFLVEALARRRAAGVAPFTVLCCDNLAHNGAAVATVVRRLASLRDHDLGRFIEEKVAFPSTMLDRIVPATTDDDRRAIAARLGVEDAAPVVAEAYTRWVIEDRFSAGRPDWASAGAELVGDIAPYEAIKLKLLNASHSAMAYLGYLAGYQTIAETIADQDFRAFIERMMNEEVTPTLKLPAGIDVTAYKRQLLARFANTAIRHRTWQIAMDGTQKLPPRLLGTIRAVLAAGAPFPRLALAVAAWMKYVAGTDERGAPIDVRDPLAARLTTIAAAAGPIPSRLAPALLAMSDVFGRDLPRDPRFVSAVTGALERLSVAGARQAVAQCGSHAGAAVPTDRKIV